MSANVETIKRSYNAIATGDVDGVVAVFDPEIVWTEAEGFPYAGTYQGIQAVVQNVLVPLATDWQEFHVRPSEFIDGGEKIVVLGRYAGTHKETGKSFECDFAHVWTMGNGKAVGFHQYVDSAIVQEALRP